MSKTISIAALCVGLLCTGLCVCAYYSEHRPGEELDAQFWGIVKVGVKRVGLGIWGLSGRLRRNSRAADHDAPLE
jgi:hypothetical protein